MRRAHEQLACEGSAFSVSCSLPTRGRLHDADRRSWCFSSRPLGSVEEVRTSYFHGYAVIYIWEFPKIRGALYWGPDNEDPTI